MRYWKKDGQKKTKRSDTERRRDLVLCILLAGAALFLCWYEIGRHGIFGSSVDWISQHSVIPDYFRRQFYATGDLFPEFALGLGGGQNIYHFAYYGLYNPLLLPSYLLPFVKMGDYLMAASALAVAASGVIFYGWQRSLKKPRGLCFAAAFLLILSGPMIFQSARQVMFVNYMPFLCMALWGVDIFFGKGRAGVYLSGVFLMILTSFYYSIGGILVLVIYGLHRYVWYREHPEQLCEASSFFTWKNWIADGLRFLFPIVTSVLLSAFFLLPTAAALMGNRSGGDAAELWALLAPKLSFFPHLYSAYGVGLTTLFFMVLLSGLFWRGWSSRVLIWSCIAVLSVPAVWWLLNGGLYVREKALIPFLPLFCYVIVCYCERRNRLWGILAYPGTIFLLYRESGYTADRYAASASALLPKVMEGGYLARLDRWTLVLLEAGFMALWYILLYIFRCLRLQRKGMRRNRDVILSSFCPGAAVLVPPVLFLALFGSSFCGTAGIESREFYEQVTDRSAGEAVERILKGDEGFYRIEQIGSASERAADINRIWNARQYSSSVYSSSYNSAYQEFRMNTFDVEEPAGNFMMQRVSENPVFQRLMGVKYLMKRVDEEKAGEAPFGYEFYFWQDGFAVYRNVHVAGLCYATDRLITEEEYRKLPFPLGQTVFEQYAVVPDAQVSGTEGADRKAEDLTEAQTARQELISLELSLPELSEKSEEIRKTEAGYQIETGKSRKVTARISEKAQEGEIVFLQFQVKNQKPARSVSIWVNGVQNTLSQKSGGYFYYNGNTAFTYAVPVTDASDKLEITFGKGSYEITEISCWKGRLSEDGDLYESDFLPDLEKTKGDRIEGQMEVKNDGYVITSIPYDENFEARIDGEAVPVQRVNTAFVGFPIEKGRHHIAVIYHAPGAGAGKLLSFLGIGMLLWQLIRAKKVERHFWKVKIIR